MAQKKSNLRASCSFAGHWQGFQVPEHVFLPMKQRKSASHRSPEPFGFPSASRTATRFWSRATNALLHLQSLLVHQFLFRPYIPQQLSLKFLDTRFCSLAPRHLQESGSQMFGQTFIRGAANCAASKACASMRHSSSAMIWLIPSAHAAIFAASRITDLHRTFMAGPLLVDHRPASRCLAPGAFTEPVNVTESHFEHH